MTDRAAHILPDGMSPVTFGGCFGWFHQARASGSQRVGVLICPGVSQDFSNAYRTFRLMAVRLAEEGYPVLRFDYPGTGDSSDAISQNLWEEWLASIHAAAGWLREEAGVTRLVLIGLRIGATLAASAVARRSDVAGLVLIEPWLHGRSYVSQLVTEARLRIKRSSGEDKNGGDCSTLEVGELLFSQESLDAMRAANLAQLPMPVDLQAAVFSSAKPEAVASRLALWHQSCASLFCGELAGLDAMLRPSQHTDEPDADLSALVDWLTRAVPPQVASRSSVLVRSVGALNLPGCVEEVLRFGEGRRLTGILCRPNGVKGQGFAVIICNSGGNPRHGFARFGVALARRLAEAGIASLRMDFAGLGDSAHLMDGVEAQTHVFNVDRARDIGDAIDALEEHGYRRFAIHGLCSGAYHAVHVARAEPRISVVLAVNLPWFSLRHERPGPDSVAQQCVGALQARHVGTLLIFGDGDPGLKQIERHFGPGGVSLRAFSEVSVAVFAGLDHELSVRWMRRIVADHILWFLQHQCNHCLKGVTQSGYTRHDFGLDGNNRTATEEDARAAE